MNNNSESSKVKIAIAIIGAAALIIAAYLGYVGAIKTATLPINATQTAEALRTQLVMITPTPISVNTLAASTPTTDVMPVTSPEDFGGLTSDCVPDSYWNVLDSAVIANAKGCLQVSSWGLHASDRKLLILLNPQEVRESISRTLFLPISGNVEISFNVILEAIRNGSDPNVSPLFEVGICNPNKVKTAHNFIAYSYPEPGLVFWGILNNDEAKFQKKDSYVLNTSQSFLIKIDSFDLFIEDTKTDDYIWKNQKVSPSDLQAFCVRYQLPTLGTLKATISDLSITKK